MAENDESKDKKSNGYAIGGIAFAGCTLIGMGIGEAYDEKKIGLYIGAGIGFLIFAVVLGMTRNND